MSLSRPVVTRSGPDLADVLGQPEARLALEFAAAGGHHLAMIGPPGAGKDDAGDQVAGCVAGVG